MSLFSIFVDLRANVADFVSGMNQSSYAARKFARETEDSFGQLGQLAEKALAPLGEAGESIGRALAGMSEAAGSAVGKFSALGSLSVAGALAGVGAAAIAAAVGLAELAIKGAEVVENLELVSQKTGIGVSGLQVLGAAGASVGVSLDDVVTGMRKFDQVLTGTGRGSTVLTATLKSLGITARDNQGALLQLADAFSNMEDGPRKDAIAVELLGRSGLNLIPVLNKGRDGILEFQSIVEEFGPVVNTRAVTALEGWKKSTLELSEAWQRTTVDIEKALLPLFSWMTEKIAVAVEQWAKFGETVSHAFDQANERLGSEGSLTPEEINNPAAALGKQGIDQSEAANSIARARAAVAQASVDQQKASYKDLFDFLAAGGQQQLELQRKKEDLAQAIALGDYKQAAALQQQINSLQQAIKLEEQRKQLREGIFNQAARAELVSPRLPEGFKKYAEPAVPSINFGPTPEQAAADQATAAQGIDRINKLREGSSAVQDFWQTYGDVASDAFDKLNARYDEQKAAWADMLNAQMIKQQDFDAISTQLEKDRYEAVVRLYQAQEEEAAHMNELVLSNPWSTVPQKFRAIADQLQLEGRDLGPKIFSSISKAIDDISDQLAKFVVTGKSNFKQLFEGLAEQIVKANLQRVFGQIAGAVSGNPAGIGGPNAPGGTAGIVRGPLGLGSSIAAAVGIKIPGSAGAGGPDGSLSNPFYTIPTDSQGNILGDLTGKNVGTKSIIGSLFGGKSSDEDNPLYTPALYNEDSGSSRISSFANDISQKFSSIFKSLDGVLGNVGKSIFGAIGGFFGGFLAGGGDVTPGKAYIVGEKHPEFFLPRQSGTVAPSLSMQNRTSVWAPQIVLQGVSDSDSFFRSEGQIAAHMYRLSAMAHSRS